MKQGNLFDELYDAQETDDYTDNTNHTIANGLYPVASEDVIKQELVTYYRVAGAVKKVTKSRNFVFNDHNDTTTIEVFK